MLDQKTRYLQIAFNDDLGSVESVLPKLPGDDRILIEAGTPFIKREDFRGIREIARLWRKRIAADKLRSVITRNERVFSETLAAFVNIGTRDETENISSLFGGGKIVADLKTMDGAVDEVELAYNAGATAATVLGDAPVETINLFIQKCMEFGMDSMIDMIGVDEPLKVLLKLKHPPRVVVLHKGRDEETTKGKVIGYKHINKIKSKYDVLISAAGGVDLREARSAIFNGANIVAVNIVTEEDPWTGIREDSDVADMAKQFLETIK
jgi:3-keto-L-gulonate-6-phosphate decarboxylase